MPGRLLTSQTYSTETLYNFNSIEKPYVLAYISLPKQKRYSDQGEKQEDKMIFSDTRAKSSVRF